MQKNTKEKEEYSFNGVLTASGVTNRWKFGQELRECAMTCVNFGRIEFTPKSAHVFHLLANHRRSTHDEPTTRAFRFNFDCLEMAFLSSLHSLSSKFKSVWPPNASLCASSTCDYSRLRLNRP